ncbi:MAG: hypothetical protein AAFP76_08950 [Bacteroidota bacterium]
MNRSNNYSIILVILLLTIPNFCALAQMDGGPTTVDARGLYTAVKNDKANPTRDFCQEVNVTVDLQLFEIEANIMVCCTTEYYICIPTPNEKMKDRTGNYPNDLEITSSSSVVQGSYRIAVKKGKYKMNDAGQITDLKYVLTKI